MNYTRQDAEFLQIKEQRGRSRPVALIDLLRNEEAARMFFDGLALHYIESIGQGRTDVWAETAHSIINLLSSPMTKVHKRIDLPQYASQGEG